MLNELNAYVMIQDTKGNIEGNKINGEVKGGFAHFFESKVGSEKDNRNSVEQMYKKVGEIDININLIIKYLRDNEKYIVLEDFHFAQDDFCRSFADDLKALSDEKKQIIIVGVEDKLPIMIKKRNDLKKRAKSLPIGHFESLDLEMIIQKGCDVLNISFSDDIKTFIVNESENRAYITQAICKNICEILDITERVEGEKRIISDIQIAEEACELIAFSENNLYSNIVREIGSRNHGNDSTQVYKWVLKVLQEHRIGTNGIGNAGILSLLRAMGNDTIKQGSINACVNKLPEILDAKDLIQVFKYENKTLYIIDDFFQFYLRWSRELLDEYKPKEV